MTSLLLPTDACPRCLECPVHPYRVDRFEQLGGITAAYTCPGCGCGWTASWSTDALNLPCPGCPLCVPPARTA